MSAGYHDEYNNEKDIKGALLATSKQPSTCRYCGGSIFKDNPEAKLVTWRGQAGREEEERNCPMNESAPSRKTWRPEGAREYPSSAAAKDRDASSKSALEHVDEEAAEEEAEYQKRRHDSKGTGVLPRPSIGRQKSNDSYGVGGWEGEKGKPLDILEDIEAMTDYDAGKSETRARAREPSPSPSPPSSPSPPPGEKRKGVGKYHPSRYGYGAPQ